MKVRTPCVIRIQITFEYMCQSYDAKCEDEITLIFWELVRWAAPIHRSN